MNEIHIIGNGASLNLLTRTKVEHINASDVIVSVNMYLPFWRKVGIVPTHYIMLDSKRRPSYV